MVKIPIATSTGNLITQTTAPRINDISTFTQATRAIGNAGRALTAVGNEFERVRQSNIAAEAKLRASTEIEKRKNEILNDPSIDGKSSDLFLKELPSIINKEASTMNQERFNQFSVEMNGVGLRASTSISNKGRQADIGRRVDTFDKLRELHIQKMLELPLSDTFGKQAEMSAITIEINQLVTDKIIDKAGVENLKEDILEDVRQRKAAVDISTAPTKEALAQVKADVEDGSYDLNLEEKVIANALINKRTQQFSRQDTKNRTGTAKDFQIRITDPEKDDIPTIDELRQSFQAEEITLSYFNSALKSIASGIDKVNEPSTVNQLLLESANLISKDEKGVYNFANEASMVEFEDFFTKLNLENAAGKIKDEKILTIVKPLLPVIDKALDDAAVEQVYKENAPKNLLDKLRFWADRTPLEDVESTKAEMSSELFDLLAEKKTVTQEDVDKIIEKQQNKINPQWQGLKAGDFTDTQFGSREIRKILDNGEPDIILLPEDIKAMQRRAAENG